MVILLHQALDLMQVLLPAVGKLEDLMEAMMMIPYSHWMTIEVNEEVNKRFKSAGFHNKNIHGLQKPVMTMPENQLTLSVEVLTSEETSQGQPLMKHASEVNKE
jgi:hypothetical protein